MSQDLPIEVSVGDVHSLYSNQDDFYFLDCRRVDEHQIAKINGAQLIPMDSLVARVNELEPYRDKRIVVHCHHGGRSLRVAQWLRQQGFSAAQSMAGGIDAWAIQIDPTIARY
jgi:rhodanese-related sulfurtransferase